MKLDVNLTDSFNYAKLLFDDFGRLIILIILAVIPIVNFIVVGYLGNILKAPKDSKELPQLEKYGELWIQGLKIFLAIIILMIVPLILMGSTLVQIVLTQLSLGGSFISPLSGILAISLFYIGLLLAFFIGLILAMSIVHMLKKDDFGKIFAFNEILAIIQNIGWGTYILWLAVLFIISGIVTVIMFNIPVIGWILELVLTPALGAFIARSVSLTYLEGTTQETATTTEQT
ncbi:MAG: DUF4013 domain-containing protein [Candidatus Bathyarchaeota archaeon]|nr:DUF4013 domain-containing protein [Candidatus Bathyarchaeum sp.]